MKAIRIVILGTVMTLAGCASYPGGYGYGAAPGYGYSSSAYGQPYPYRGYRVSPQVYQGAAVGAAVGAGAGALIDKHNRWRGAVIGAGLGSLLGGGLAGVQQPAR